MRSLAITFYAEIMVKKFLLTIYNVTGTYYVETKLNLVCHVIFKRNIARFKHYLWPLINHSQ